MRKHKKLSQEDLATKIGIHRVGMSNIERGETSVSFDRVVEICTQLNCSLDELIHFEDPVSSQDKKDHISPTEDVVKDITETFQYNMQKIYLNRLIEITPFCTKKAMNATTKKLTLDVNFIFQNTDLSELAKDQIEVLWKNVNQHYANVLKNNTHEFTKAFVELIEKEF